MQRFDEDMRNRARDEKITLTADAELFFQSAMRKARLQGNRQAEANARNRSRKMWAIVAAECAIAVALLLWLPVRDVTRQHAVNRQYEHEAAMTPVTQGTINKGPFAQIDMMYVQDSVTLQGRFENFEDDDIWLIRWQAELEAPAGSEQKDELIWLETAAECSRQFVWEDVQSQQAMAKWSYTAYRVTADMLHWLDGEQLSPDAEDYDIQQMLMMDAFDARVLILEAGEWDNGMAGPVRVLLPDQVLETRPEMDVLAYCVENGLLEDGSLLCGGHNTGLCTKLE